MQSFHVQIQNFLARIDVLKVEYANDHQGLSDAMDALDAEMSQVFKRHFKISDTMVGAYKDRELVRILEENSPEKNGEYPTAM